MPSFFFALRALPALLGAAVELRRFSRLARVHELPQLLREDARLLPAGLQDPARLAALVDAVSPFLPPRELGPCLRKSLLILHLWARCGLSPRLHLGAQSSRGPCPDFHAWVSAGKWEHGRGEHRELWSG